MATKYCSPTGSDTTGTGTAGNPWKSLQKLANNLAAGDIGLAKNGTYTAAMSAGQTNASSIAVCYLRNTVANGTSSQRITLAAENPRGAIITIPDATDGTAGGSNNHGIRVTKSFWNIEGFEFTGGALQTDVMSHAGITLATGNNNEIRNCFFNLIARQCCSNSLFGNAGILGLTGITNCIVEKNTFGGIGRLRNGESGCSTNIFMHDHGLYIEGSVSMIVRRNIFYDTNRGFPLNFKARDAGTKTFHLKVYNNVVVGKAPVPPGLPEGQFGLTNEFDDVLVKNNIFLDPENGYVMWWHTNSTPLGTGITLQKNLTNSPNTEVNITNPNLRPSSGITLLNNVMNTNPSFTNSAGNVYTLNAGSPAINSGIDVGNTYYGSAPDAGAYQVPIFLSATVENGSPNIIRVNFGVVDYPLLPATGVTGFTTKLNGSPNTITSATISNSTVLLQVTNAVDQGDTVTFSYSGGNVTDSADLGNTNKQKLAHTFTDQTVTNNVFNPNVAPAVPTGLTGRRL